MCRTGGLAIDENWEAVLSEAEGDYLLLVSDKCLLRRFALAVGLAACEEHGSPLSSGWLTHLTGDDPPLRLETRHGSGVHRVVRTKDVAAAFARGPLNLTRLGFWLPLPYATMFHRSLAEAARNGPAGALFIPITPDSTSAYQFLALTDHYVQIDYGVAIYRGGEPGNVVSLARDDAIVRALEARVPKAGVLLNAQLPFPYPTFVNYMLRDYHLVQHFYPERLPPLDLSLPAYLAAVICDTQSMPAFGGDVREHSRRLQRVLADISSAARAAIEAHLREVGRAEWLNGPGAIPPMGETVAFMSSGDVLDWEEQGGEYLRRQEHQLRAQATEWHEKERAIQTLARACEEKAREIESLGRVAAERLALLEWLHAEAARRGAGAPP